MDHLDEFDSSREIIQDLVDEYRACEQPDYLDFGMEDFGYNGKDEDDKDKMEAEKKDEIQTSTADHTTGTEGSDGY